MKKVLYVFGAIIGLYLLLCLLGPKNCTVKREILISAPKQNVLNAICDLQFFQKNWSPWTELDPKMEATFTGQVCSVGYKYAWKGNKDVGVGTLEILRITPDSIIENLHFDDMGDSRVFHVVSEANGQSKMTWGIDIEFDFLGRGMMLFMNMDKMMGADFEKGLAKLKTVMENMPKEEKHTAYEVKEVNWDEKTFIGKKGTFKFDKLSGFFAENYPKLFEELGKAKLEPMMAPSAIYFKWDEKNQETECAAVANVASGFKTNNWEKFNIPASKVLHIAYYGSWDKSMYAHMAMDEYIKSNNLPVQTHVIEEYVTDPMTEKDTAKWLTNIFYVIPAK